MRILLIAMAMILVAVSPTWAQKETEQEALQRKQNEKDAEKAYQRAIKSTRPNTATTQAPKSDPWGTVRPGNQNPK